jgi:hypothetical protein
MPEPPNSLPSVLRHTRIVWSSLLLAQFLYILGGPIIVGSTPLSDPTPAFTIGIAVAAVCALFLVLFIRIRLLRRAIEALQSNPTDAVAIAKWRKLQITTMVIVETVPLFGLMLLTTGVPLNQVALFYAAGIAAMLLVFPKNPARQS